MQKLRSSAWEWEGVWVKLIVQRQLSPSAAPDSFLADCSGGGIMLQSETGDLAWLPWGKDCQQRGTGGCYGVSCRKQAGRRADNTGRCVHCGLNCNRLAPLVEQAAKWTSFAHLLPLRLVMALLLTLSLSGMWQFHALTWCELLCYVP